MSEISEDLEGFLHPLVVWEIRDLENKFAAVTAERDRYRSVLESLARCNWVISLPDRMDAVRKIAQDALRRDVPETNFGEI
jgi:hypothetical protein